MPDEGPECNSRPVAFVSAKDPLMGTRTWLGRTIPLRGLPTPHLSKQKVLAEWLSETGPAAWSRLGPERTGPVAGRSVVLFLEVQVPEDRADGSEGLWVILPAAAAAAARISRFTPASPTACKNSAGAADRSACCSAVNGTRSTDSILGGAGEGAAGSGVRCLANRFRRPTVPSPPADD